MTADDIPLDRYKAERASIGSPLKLLSYAEMSRLEQPRWLVEGVIQQTSTAVLFGRSNTFKTFLAIDLGLSVASGIDWHGSPVVPGDVAFIATEGANAVARLRIPAWFDRKGIAEKRRRAFLFPNELRLDVPDEVSGLIGALRKSGHFRLVILDIFGGTMAGSEVEDKTARAWVQGVQRILSETGASVLAVAHTGWQDVTRARMHTHFWGSFDSRLRVDGNKDAQTATMTVDRHKDAGSLGQWSFRLREAGASLVPELDDSVSSSRRSQLKAGLGLQTLDIAIASSAIAVDETDWPPNSKVTSVETWRHVFCEASGLERMDARRQAFKRAKDSLIDQGLICIRGELVGRSARA